MYYNISKLDFSKLRKLEVRNLASRVIKIVDQNDPEALNIKEGFDLLEAKEPRIDLLDVGPGPHPLTPDIQELRFKRRALGRGIVEQVRSIVNSKMSGTAKDRDVVNRAVNQYLKDIWYTDDVVIHESIDLFFNHLSKSEELQTATSALGLVDYLDNLESVNLTIEKKYNVRRTNVSERPKSITPIIISELKGAIEYLFKQIEVAQVINQELDYTLLVDDLNEEIAFYRAKIKTRASYSKKRAEEALKGDNVDETDNDVVVETNPEVFSENSNPTVEIMLARQVEDLTNGNGEFEDVSGLLDKKKTVAVSSKQTRLPDVSNEA